MAKVKKLVNSAKTTVKYRLSKNSRTRAIFTHFGNIAHSDKNGIIIVEKGSVKRPNYQPPTEPVYDARWEVLKKMAYNKKANTDDHREKEVSSPLEIDDDQFNSEVELVRKVNLIGKFLKSGFNADENISSSDKKIIEQFQSLSEEEQCNEFEKLQAAFFAL